MKFADLANQFSQRLSDMSRELSSVEGPLEVGIFTPCRYQRLHCGTCPETTRGCPDDPGPTT